MSTGFFDTSGAGLGGGNRPDRLCDGGGIDRSIQEWFDTSCFPVVFGRLGNSSRMVLAGPGQHNFDFSINKTFLFGEVTRMEFRTEFFNIFNTAQFDFPDTNPLSGSFGEISGTINTSRQIQFALKLTF